MKLLYALVIQKTLFTSLIWIKIIKDQDTSLEFFFLLFSEEDFPQTDNAKYL